MKLRQWGYKPETRVEALLGELCVMHGYCLPPDEQVTIINVPLKTWMPLSMLCFWPTGTRIRASVTSKRAFI